MAMKLLGRTVSRKQLKLGAIALILALLAGLTYPVYGMLRPVSGSCPTAPAERREFNIGIATGDVFGVMSDQQIDDYMADVQSLCIRVVRVDLKWDKAEPTQGSYDLTHLEVITEAAERHGIYVRGIVDSAPAWAVAPECLAELKGTWRCAPREDPDDDDPYVQAMADFAAMATTVMHGRLLKLEVMNEPNSMPEFSHDPARYSRLYRAVRAAVTTADPEVAVGPGGTAAVGRTNLGGDGMSAPDWYRKLCENGVCAEMDFVAMHPYDWPMPPSAVDPLWGQITQVDKILEAAGAGAVRIDLTEMGFPTGGSKSSRSPVNELTQALYFNQTLSEFERLKAAGVVGELDVYSLVDNARIDASSVEAHFGLIRSDGQSKPARTVVRNYAFKHGF